MEIVVLKMESGKVAEWLVEEKLPSVVKPLLSPALIGTRTSLSSHQGGETQLVS